MCLMYIKADEMGANLVPVDLANATAKVVAAGQSHTCVVLDSGQVACWGYNSVGQVSMKAPSETY